MYAFRSLFPALLALAMTLTISGSVAAATRAATLYERIGGSPAITSITNDLIDAAVADPRTAATWRKVTLGRVKRVLAEYLCAKTGGPCTYQGDTMKEIHAGLNIDESQMYAIVEMLRTTMIRHDVALRERNELLAILAPTKRDIVTK